MSRMEEIKAKCENVITAGLLDGDPYDDVKEYIEALESALAESQKELFNMSYVKALAAESTVELEKYRAAEQDGRLIVLPCKIDDIVYRICPKCNDSHNGSCNNCAWAGTANGSGCNVFGLWKDGQYPPEKCTIVPMKATYNRIKLILDYWEKRIFSTPEAAEQALNEQKEREPQ